jgi:PAB-dependent poly(A)-specific ribonuclease subunit 3
MISIENPAGSLPWGSHYGADTTRYVIPGLPAFCQATSSYDASGFDNILLTPQQIQYHLYAPVGTDRTRLEGYQRLIHNLFMPNDLREDLQKKAEATLRVLPTSNLPAVIAHFQSLYPLDTSATKNTGIYGYPTSIYKAKSSQDGRYYALRRVEGYRLEREEAIRSVQKWKTVRSANLVSIHEAFTTRDFGDSSLILITDYHPNSKTLQEVHFSSPARTGSTRSQSASYVGEHVLWAYIVQIAHALKAIHSAGLAARVITPSKILQTSKNRVRLNGCGVIDIVQYDTLKPVPEAQQDDFIHFGKLLLAVASANANAALNIEKAVANLSRSTYSAPLKQAIGWLLAPAQYGQGSSVQQGYAKDIDTLLSDISAQSTRVLESSLSENDQLLSTLSAELENGRIVRLFAKLNCITERPEFEHNPQWSETGDRYYLKLFRDYVFHQVDSEGRPVVDLGWIVSCANKLDAGSEEKIALVSRDEQVVFVVSYRDVKKGVESAFNELFRAGGGGRR